MKIFMKYLCFSFLFFKFIILVQAGDSLGDPFDGNEFKNPNWLWSNEPEKWDISETRDGWLTIFGEHNRDLWATDDSNRLYQVHSGDFHVEASMIFDYADISTVQGVIALSPTTKDNQGREGDWVTLKLWGRGADNGNTAVLQYQARERDNEPGLTGTHPPYGQVKQGAIPVYMRMQRTGKKFKSWYKVTEKGRWETVGVYESDLKDPIEVGLYAGIGRPGPEGELTSHFEYFKDVDNPFTVESKDKLTTIWGKIKTVE
ncbi:hypothetical protein CMK13_16865 [Candidatus Poribacteria bacterium]|nr:hypothetical protein [Candidatus Poribacteria bacterium]OUT56053.1 MAG: hypothetical protein CBB75_16230 [bacterium TMED15]